MLRIFTSFNLLLVSYILKSVEAGATCDINPFITNLQDVEKDAVLFSLIDAIGQDVFNKWVTIKSIDKEWLCATAPDLM